MQLLSKNYCAKASVGSVERRKEAEGLEPPTHTGNHLPSDLLIQPGCFHIFRSRASALSASEGPLRVCEQKLSVEGA